MVANYMDDNTTILIEYSDGEKNLLLYYKQRALVHEYCLRKMTNTKSVIKSLFLYPSILITSAITILNALEATINDNASIKYINIAMGVASALCITIPERMRLTHFISQYTELANEYRQLVMQVESELIDDNKSPNEQDFVKNISIKYNMLLLKSPFYSDKLFKEAETKKKDTSQILDESLINPRLVAP
jgi:hypothetical protein